MGYWIPRCRASAAAGSAAAAALGFEDFDDDEMTAGMNQLELNIISAQDVKKEERWMQTAVSGIKSGGSGEGGGRVQVMYALASLQSKKMRTHSVACGDQNPTWNARLHFLVHDEFLKDESSAAMTVEVYAQSGRRAPSTTSSATVPKRRDTLLGTARVLLSTLAKKGRGYQGAQTLALQLRRPSGRPQGILNIGCIVHAYDDRLPLPAPSRLNLLDAEAAAAAASTTPAHPPLPHSTTPRFSAFKEIQEKCRKSFSITSSSRASSADQDSGFRHQLAPARASSAAASFGVPSGMLHGLIPPPPPSAPRRFSLDARHSFAYELRHGLVVNTPSTSSSAASCTASSASSSAIADVDDYICYYEDDELAVSQFPEHSGVSDDEGYPAGCGDVVDYDYVEEEELDAEADEEEELAMEAIYRKLKSCIKINDDSTTPAAPTVISNSSSNSSSSSFSIEASTVCSSSTTTTTTTDVENDVEIISGDSKSCVSENVAPKKTMKTMEEFAEQIRDMETFTKAIEDQRATSMHRMKAVAQTYKTINDDDCIAGAVKFPAETNNVGAGHSHEFITMELQENPLAALKPPRHRAPWAKRTNWAIWSKGQSKIHLSPSDQKLN